MSLETFKKSQLYFKRSPNLNRLGFDFKNDIDREYKKIQSMLFTEYHINNESMLTIMKKFEIPSSRTIDILFRLFDIKSKSLSDANKNAIETGRSTPPANFKFQQIYHTTWFDETVFLRSSYELDYAKILDENKTLYEVECMRIKYYDTSCNKFRIAIPDFYLPETNTIVEIKSTYWLNDEEMRCKANEYIRLGFKFILNLEHQDLVNWLG